MENSDNAVVGLCRAAPAEFFEDCAAANMRFKLVLDASVAVAGEYPICDVAFLYQHSVWDEERRAVSATPHQQITKSALEKPTKEDGSNIEHGSLEAKEQA